MSTASDPTAPDPTVPVRPASESAAPNRWLRAALADLYATRESPRQAEQPRRPRRPRGAAPAEAPARRGAEQRSLFLEILDWMMVPLLLLWPLSVGVTFLIARSLADAPFDRALTDRVQLVAQQVRASGGYLAPVLPASADELLPDGSGAADDERTVVQVLAADGALLAGDRRLPTPRLYDFPETDRIKLRTEQHAGRDLRVGYVYVDLAPGPDERLVLVQIGEPTDRRNRLANEIIKGVIFPQFVILPGAVLLVWFGLGRGLVPLKLLQQRIRERSPDDASPIDRRGAPEEVAPLIDAFNELLARQNQSVRAQKRFIADAAHQIKTPLAGLQTQAELALRSQDAAEVRRSLEQLLRGSARAARMVSQLLAMARAEHLRDAQAFGPLDLVALARETVGDWVPMALARGIEIEFDAPEHALRVDGQPMLLRELLNNLLDNALRYTPQGGSVSVRVGRMDAALPARVRLEVVDTGPGIAPAERELVFEPFYRVLGTQVDGSGLGLAIVREIAQQHGARVTVESAGETGAPAGAGAVASTSASTGARLVVEFQAAASA